MELFFITGFGKSGTTWLQHALNKKKEIVCRGEGRFVAGFKNIYLIKVTVPKVFKGPPSLFPMDSPSQTEPSSKAALIL